MSFPFPKTILLSFLLLGLTNLAIANNYDSVEYNLNFIDIKDSVLKVEIILQSDFKNKLILDLPSRWAGTSYIDQIKKMHRLWEKS
jgi:hypothetical protein